MVDLELRARQRIRSDPELAEYETALFGKLDRVSNREEYLAFLATAETAIVLEYAYDAYAETEPTL